MKHSLRVLAAYIFLTLLATHPLWQQLSDAVPGDIGDPVLNTYILAWDVHALVNDPPNIFNANIFYPLPNALAYSENLMGDALIALPISLLSGEPVLAYNFTFLLSFVLAAFGMYLLMLYCTRNRRAAFVAGVAFAFAPYRLASLAHIQLLTVQWLPLLALALLHIRAHASQRPLFTMRISSYLFFWLQVAASLHGAIFAAFIYVITLLARTWRELSRGPVLIPRYPSRLALLPFFIFLIALTPIAQPYLALLPELRAARPSDVTRSFVALPSDFLAAYPWNRLLGTATEIFRQRDGFTEEQTLFMGIVAPLLALFGLLQRHRDSHGELGVGSWNLLFGGLFVGALLFATSAWLVQAIPLASIMRVPARWGIVLSFALAGLCGMGVASILKKVPLFNKGRGGRGEGWSSSIFIIILSALIFLEGFAAPIPLAKIGALQAQPTVYQYLAQQAGREAIIELPVYVAPDAEYPEGKRMYASTLHWRPLVNGYSGFTPARQLTLAAQLKNFPDEPSLAALRALARQGVRYVIVHAGEPGIPRREWTQTNRARAMQSGVLRFVQSFNDNDLFEIVAE